MVTSKERFFSSDQNVYGFVFLRSVGINSLKRGEILKGNTQRNKFYMLFETNQMINRFEFRGNCYFLFQIFWPTNFPPNICVE